MEKVNTLNQMARYDFAAPINVTMIFEEDSDDETIAKSPLKEIIQNRENNKLTGNEYKSKEKYFKSEELTTDLVENNTVTEDSMITVEIPLIDKSSIIEADLDNNGNKSLPNNKNHAVTDMIAYNMPEINQEQTDKEELTSYVKNLLNTLSEHIIFIMQGYYNHYYSTQSQPPNPNAWNKLSKLKKHFFDLSYSSVLTLIIPQENNKMFIQQFIDKTMNEANKRMKWKCERQHVQRVYSEMIDWTKRKREHLNKLREQNVNETEKNKLLKEHLNKPTRPLNITQPTAPLPLQDHNKEPPKSKNGACIFSYGAPGREISITVDPDTLIRHNSIQCQRNSPNSVQRQHNSPNSMQYQRNSPNSMQYQRNSPNSMQYQLNSPNSMQYQRNIPNSMQYQLSSPNSMQYQRNSPNSMQCQQSSPERRSTTNDTRGNGDCSRYLQNNQPPHINPYNRHMQYLPSNYYQNNTIHHYPTQLLPPPPPRPPPPYGSHCNGSPVTRIYPFNMNQIQTNINHAMQNQAVARNGFAPHPMNPQFGTRCTERQAVEGPIITNVTSLNQTALPKTGRCCVCGKIVDASCKNPYYCGALCQVIKELDSGMQCTYGKT